MKLHPGILAMCCLQRKWEAPSMNQAGINASNSVGFRRYNSTLHMCAAYTCWRSQ